MQTTRRYRRDSSGLAIANTDARLATAQARDLSEAAAVYERAASIVRAIEGVGSAAYEELMVRMDLVDDAIAEEKRARREDREKAGL